MTRQEIIDRVSAIIREQVDGSAFYDSTCLGDRRYLDYPVEIDEGSIFNAAREIADFINDFVRDEDR